MIDPKTPLLLFAEDDDEDWMLIEDSFEEFHSPNRLERVKDGVELLERLRDKDLPRPDLVLLDLKMPRMGGHEALTEIRNDDVIGYVPVVIMTSSTSETDVMRSYREGANSYVAKPVTLSNLRLIGRYWGDVVLLPHRTT